ncbi:MAG TPA: carbohydrate-binding domain-containing protein [Polyangiaceae bacterium]|nr:carbohydrate-binding domain-containing protein [Polyangiaceae bacterium]
MMKQLLRFAVLASVFAPASALAQSQPISTCQAVTYQAEAMFKSTGGAVAGGWNIWSNGYISTNHVFGGASTVITVRARGESALGVAPTMVVSVGGATVYTTSVASTSWADYTFITSPSAGSREVRVSFTNDYYAGGQDRNLFVDSVQVGSSDGWTDLTLRNGWTGAANSCAPGVKLINDTITYRGGLSGAAATSDIAFCLTPSLEGSPDYTAFQTVDLGYVVVRAAMAGGATGSVIVQPPHPLDPFSSYCAQMNQDGSAEIGPAAKAFTSLEGVSYDRTTNDAQGVDRDPEWEGSPYAWRGHDGTQHEGANVYAKLVDGFVRFQGIITPSNSSTTGALLLTLPDPAMFPDRPVSVPVVMAPSSDQIAGSVGINTNGEVVVLQSLSQALADGLTGVSLDGVSFAVSSTGAQSISLANGWVQQNSRPVRARYDEGVVRLEGSVTAGDTPTIGTLPAGLRPSKTVYVPVVSALFGLDSTLSIDPSGTITVIDPDAEMELIGISLEGVSFSAPQPFQCTGGCLSATPLARNQNSGPFGTTGERWFVVNTSINGWQASEIQGRTITVNGVPVTAGQMPLPAPVGGAYYFRFSAGANNWSSMSFW